ncbi:hypothetical protein DFQ10_101772 [Winogradskyella eximia]|jgi:hypothetical protein|uniref:Uncharacterized protein n=1 Tax=Winogradskyella eximia TaxID=262006 RepID=A0A3D9HBX6_9FLAO|nr:hypothetical protein DFQ10_101772 [Winogradskyella eximia]
MGATDLIKLIAIRLTAVRLKGRKLDRETLDSFNENAINRKNLVATALRYLENLVIEK